MELVERYYCKFCKGYFKTPDRHRCRKDPANKTCTHCKNLWFEWIPGNDMLEGYQQASCEMGIDLTERIIFDCPEWEAKYPANKDDCFRNG